MAMTKAEKARMEELETALALCWPSYPLPLPMTVEEIKSAPQVDAGESYGGRRKAAKGYFQNAYTSSVTQGFSNGTVHSRFGSSSWSQTAGEMYRTKREALMAMRHEMSKDFAEKLAAIDRRIAAAPLKED